jgi:lipoprotein-anchoring transpeptidase ErfK/SrfK
MLYAHEGQTTVLAAVVSTGTRYYPTVTGRFNIYAKYTSTLMTGPGYYLPDVPYTMYFYGGYAIHGTYWHNNFGTPMSHGCVNMKTPEAKWLFNWAPSGTLVVVHR